VFSLNVKRNSEFSTNCWYFENLDWIVPLRSKRTSTISNKMELLPLKLKGQHHFCNSAIKARFSSCIWETKNFWHQNVKKHSLNNKSQTTRAELSLFHEKEEEGGMGLKIKFLQYLFWSNSRFLLVWVRANPKRHQN